MFFFSKSEKSWYYLAIFLQIRFHYIFDDLTKFNKVKPKPKKNSRLQVQFSLLPFTCLSQMVNQSISKSMYYKERLKTVQFTYIYIYIYIYISVSIYLYLIIYQSIYSIFYIFTWYTYDNCDNEDYWIFWVDYLKVRKINRKVV